MPISYGRDGRAIRVLTAAEIEHLLPQLDEAFVFGRDRSVSLERRYPRMFRMDESARFIGVEQSDEIVSSLGCRFFTWRVKESKIRGMMIGLVHTHVDHRGRCLATSLLRALDHIARIESVQIGILWTSDPRVYERSGWVAGTPSYLGLLEGLKSSKICHIPQFCDPSEFAEQLEKLRANLVESRVMRDVVDYSTLPLPAVEVRCLLDETESGQLAYALVGFEGSTAYVYELIGVMAQMRKLLAVVQQQAQEVLVNAQSARECTRLEQIGKFDWTEKPQTYCRIYDETVQPDSWREKGIAYMDRI